jgi:NAD(P)-dependent dehydrogenase (short-subunit alcohol dehydrogenase family)
VSVEARRERGFRAGSGGGGDRDFEQDRHVALAAHRRDALLEVRAGLEREDGGSVRSVIVPTDVTDRGQVGSLGSRAEEELGPVDLLVNCAGDIYYFLVSFPKYTTTQSQVPCPTRRR